MPERPGRPSSAALWTSTARRAEGKADCCGDGIDGLTHHIAGIAPERLKDVRVGGFNQIGPAEVTAVRPHDCRHAEDGIYRPSHHLEQAKFVSRVPGGDYEGYVEAPVRRLKALRRAGLV